MAERWRIIPKVIRLGSATTEDVPDERLRFYRELVADVHQGAVSAEPSQTIYLSFEQLRSAWQLYDRIIADVPTSEDPVEGTVVLVDFTLSPHELIIQTVAAYTGKALGTLLLTNPGLEALVLMPAMGTGLQQAFRDIVGAHHPGHLIIQYGDGSRVRVSAGQVDDEQIQPPDPEYAEQLQRLNQPIDDRLGGKILRRLGHYRFGSSEKYCTRYFFDASYAIQEVSQLTKDIVLEEQNGSAGPLMIVSHQAHSPWLVEVGAEVAQRLGIRHFPVSAGDDLANLPTSGDAVLLLDVVNTGRTTEALIGGLCARGLVVRPTIIAVFIDRERLGQARDSFPMAVDRRTYRVRGVAGPIARRKTERTRCEQCLAGIHPADPLADRPGIRSYDMWEMLLTHEWVPEKYGPGDPDQTSPGPPRFSLVPDFTRIFEEYGDWIAYKLDEMLEATRVGGAGVEEAVYVCPAEPAMNTLTDQLKARRGARPVAVKIPRRILWAAERDDFSEVDRHAELGWGRQLSRLAEQDMGWGRQLSLLAERDSYAVAIIDEFNGSNTTALSMLKILRRFGITALAYLPVINRNPGSALRLAGGPEVPIRPLYEIPSPRLSVLDAADAAGGR
ncbi:hypothetical protein [Micromonospora sp. NPDC049891]|uniref:hypothetical protein n=1 Tax=Micromonospora sp. NPDC049891 TaxID=3155655 RepID=UPI0033D72CD5